CANKEDLVSHIDLLTSDYSSLLSKLDSLNKQNKDQIKNLQSQIDECYSSKLIETTKELITKIALLEICCSQLATNTQELNSIIGISFNKLQSQFEDLKSYCAERITQDKSDASYYEELSSKVAHLEIICDNLQNSDDYHELNSCIEELKSNCRSLHIKIREIEHSCDKNNSESGNLKTTINQLQSKIDVCCSPM